MASITGTGDGELGTLTASAIGNNRITGTGDGELRTLSAAGLGKRTATATGDGELGALTAAAAGGNNVAGTAAELLDTLLAAAIGTVIKVRRPITSSALVLGHTRVSALLELNGAYQVGALAAGKTAVSITDVLGVQLGSATVTGSTLVRIGTNTDFQLGTATCAGATKVLIRSTLVTAGAGGDTISTAPMSDNEPIAIGMGLTGTFTAGFAEGT